MSSSIGTSGISSEREGSGYAPGPMAFRIPRASSTWALSNVCYIIGVLKSIREQLGKSDVDIVRIVVERQSS